MEVICSVFFFSLLFCCCLKFWFVKLFVCVCFYVSNVSLTVSFYFSRLNVMDSCCWFLQCFFSFMCVSVNGGTILCYFFISLLLLLFDWGGVFLCVEGGYVKNGTLQQIVRVFTQRCYIYRGVWVCFCEFRVNWGNAHKTFYDK